MQAKAEVGTKGGEVLCFLAVGHLAVQRIHMICKGHLSTMSFNKLYIFMRHLDFLKENQINW